MSKADSYFDAFVIGSGPNGFSSAITLAEQGLKVKIIEAKDTIGGGTRTKEITSAGFLHDICSAVHPTAAGSPIFNKLPLAKHGLEWIQPEIGVAHPLDNGDAVIIEKSFENTLARLGKDAKGYKSLFQGFINSWDKLSSDVFSNLRIPSHPLTMARFGWYGMFSAKIIADSFFKNERTKAYFAGLAAHSIIPLEKAFTASFGLILGTSVHTVGWPIAKGGSQSITNALQAHFLSLGGEVELNRPITSIHELPEGKPILFDLTPHQIVDIVEDKLPSSTKKKLGDYVYGPGAFKVDFALSEPVPWMNEECKKAGTLHLGGTFNELAKAEREVWNAIHPDNPYVLIAQPTASDPSRAPEGKHVLWSYCHVPNGSTTDMKEAIIKQIERYAPGFRDTIIESHSMSATQFQKYNPNYIGGDINGGAQTLSQLFGRPLLKWDPYDLPVENLYICSSSTPPGGGVHGMSGFYAAKSVLRKEYGIKTTL